MKKYKTICLCRNPNVDRTVTSHTSINHKCPFHGNSEYRKIKFRTKLLNWLISE